MLEGKYIILEQHLSEGSKKSSTRGLPATREFVDMSGRLKLSVEKLKARDVADLNRDPGVKLAPAIPVKLIVPVPIKKKATETASSGGATWGITATGADKSSFTGQGVSVAVLDTGIDAKHEAFKGVKIKQKDFTGEGNGDQNGHGTHCAGTIFGQVVNGFRFGIASGIDKALIGKVLGKKGGGTTDQIIKAIQWALDEGANVISMSLGMDYPGLVSDLKDQGYPIDFATGLALDAYRSNVRLFDTLLDHVRARASSGVFEPSEHVTLVVAASGNESKRDKDKRYKLPVAPPAITDGIISVGALGQDTSPQKLKIASFSNTGPIVSGPGVAVYSAKAGGGYVEYSGTSMATPHVAGIAALWADKLKKESNFNLDVLTAKLIGSATRTPLASGFDPLDVGAGLVQAP
jgi:subtilisin family serine protease